MHKASVVPEGRYSLPSSSALSGMCAGLTHLSATPIRRWATVLPRLSSFRSGTTFGLSATYTIPQIGYELLWPLFYNRCYRQECLSMYPHCPPKAVTHIHRDLLPGFE